MLVAGNKESRLIPDMCESATGDRVFGSPNRASRFSLPLKKASVWTRTHPGSSPLKSPWPKGVAPRVSCVGEVSGMDRFGK